MDLQIVNYDHTLHYPEFWPVFRDFWMEVNGKNLEKIKNVEVDGNVYVTTELEEKIIAITREKCLKVAVFENEIVGFIQYQEHKNGVLYVDSMYVTINHRLHGVTRALINTFPTVRKILFQIHRNNPPEMMLKGFASARKVADCDDRDLELWEAEYLPDIQGKNDAVIEIKRGIA